MRVLWDYRVDTEYIYLTNHYLCYMLLHEQMTPLPQHPLEIFPINGQIFFFSLNQGFSHGRSHIAAVGFNIVKAGIQSKRLRGEEHPFFLSFWGGGQIIFDVV